MPKKKTETTLKRYKVRCPETQEIETVKAEEIKLKGYSKARFIAYKDENHWWIHEMTTGMGVNVELQTTLAKAKQSSREFLAEKTGKDQKVLLEEIARHEVLNKEK
jgi:hypothetical protein